MFQKLFYAAVIAAAAVSSNVAFQAPVKAATVYYPCHNVGGGACACNSGDYFVNYTTCAHDALHVAPLSSVNRAVLAAKVQVSGNSPAKVAEGPVARK